MSYKESSKSCGKKHAQQSIEALSLRLQTQGLHAWSDYMYNNARLKKRKGGRGVNK